MRQLGVDNGGLKVSCDQGAKEEVIGEGKNAFVVMGAVVVIWAVGEGVGMVRRARFVDQVDIVVPQGKDVAGEAAVNLLGAPIVLKVLVVGKNINNELSAKEEVAPMFKGTDDRKKFAVPDGVISFGFGEGSGIVSYRVAESVGIALVEDGACRILRGIYLYFKGFIVVGLMEDRVSSCEGNEAVEGSGAGGCPDEVHAFLKEV